MPACLCYSGLFRPCLAMPCLPASAITPCLLPLFAFAPVFIPSPCVPGSSRKLQRLPCRQPHTWTALVQPVHRFVFACVIHLVHVKGEAWDCIGQPATFLFISRGKPGTALGSRLPSCSCIGSQRLHLGSLAILFKWPVGWHMACQVRVSCLQQLKTKKKVQ